MGLSTLQSGGPPFTFGCILWPGFEISPCACARPKAAVVDDEGVGLPGELFRLSTLSSSFQILAMWPVAAISPPTSRLMCQVPPTSSCCARRQSEWSHCRPGSGLLTWHLSASTADSLLTQWQFILKKYHQNNSQKKLFSQKFDKILMWMDGWTDDVEEILALKVEHWCCSCRCI